MINFVLTNDKLLNYGELENYLKSNSEVNTIDIGSWKFISNIGVDDALISKEEEDFILFGIGNPLLLDHFNEVLNATSLYELWKEPKKILELYKLLNGINGFLLIQRSTQTIYLYTDLLGYWPLYYAEFNNSKYFTDSLKNLNFLIPDRLHWDNVAIQAYYENGHFISGRCWYKGVRKGYASSVYEASLTSEIKCYKFWGWDEIQMNSKDINWLLTEYINAFQIQFNGNWTKNKKVGVALSGGLDSRWVLSEWCKVATVESFSFSTENSLDKYIAQKVSQQLNCKWNPIVLTKDNWLKDREELFWECDGMLTLDQFHEGNIYQWLKDKFEIISTGFYGGGVYPSVYEADNRINEKIARKWFKFGEMETRVSDSYFNIERIDPYISSQKIANQGALHIYNLSRHLKTFIPFYNINWLLINYSIPDQFQVHHRFYLKALKMVLPDKLLNIAWQRTWIPVKYIKLNILFLRLKLDKILDALSKIIRYPNRFVRYEFMEKQLDELILKLKRDNVNFEPDNLTKKWRLVSILLWMEMTKEKKSNVL